MGVSYHNNAIVPAPFVTIRPTNQEMGDGRKSGAAVSITLSGQLATIGNADPNAGLSLILQQQAAVRQIFSTDGGTLDITGLNGNVSVSFTSLRVVDIDFPEDLWFNHANYTVTLEGVGVSGETDGNQLVVGSSVAESWSFDEAEAPHTYHVSHTVSATGQNKYEDDGSLLNLAWENAKTFVTGKLCLGLIATDPYYSPRSGNTLIGVSAVDMDATTPYNHYIVEQINEAEGSYSATETYLLSNNVYTETYTIATRRVSDQPNVTTEVSISGTIQGLFVTLHDIEQKIINAQTGWAIVQTELLGRASAYVSGATITSHPLVNEVNFDAVQGTVSYSYQYSDRQVTNNTFEVYSVNCQTSDEDGASTVTVEGTITGILYTDDPATVALRYSRAKTQWTQVQPVLMARAVTESGLTDLVPFPVTATYNPQPSLGVISYSYSFNNRIPQTVKHEPNVSTRYSKDDGRTVIDVSGTITGLRVNNASNPFSTNVLLERFANAYAFWGGINGNLLGVAAGYQGVDISKVNPDPYTYTVSELPNQGQISYGYQFTSKPVPSLIQGSLSEIMTFTTDNAVPLFAKIVVPGRGSGGPIRQNLNTVSEIKLSVTLEALLPVKYTDKVSNYGSKPTFDITQFAPTGSNVILESNPVSWNPVTGIFTTSAVWSYN